MTQFKFFGLFLFCLMVSTISFSQRQFEVEGNIGGSSLKGELAASTPNSFPNISVTIRRHLNSSLALSGNYTHLTFESQEGGDFQISAREFNALLDWYPLKRIKIKGIDLDGKISSHTKALQPYFRGGVTAANLNYDKPNALMNQACNDFCSILTGYFALQVGGGFRLFFNEDVAMNMNLAWRFSNTDDLDRIVESADDWYVNGQIGVVWAIRKRSTTE
ncbi:MAG: outer membrane beta-barrel protein [Bacteroidota bacterium]